MSSLAVGGLALSAGVYYAVCGLLIHLSFHSYGWDLGIFDQVLWSIAHGHGFHYSFRSMWYLGDHFQPMLVFLAPLVWLKLGAAPILVVQGLAFGAAVVPLHAAVRRLGEPIAAWGLSAAYVVSLGPARAVSYDFHPECFVPLFAFIALWGLAANRPGVFVAATLALLPIKEDMALLVLGLCWVAWLGFAEKQAAKRVAIVSLAYFVVVSLIVIPLIAHGNSNPLVERYPYLGDSPSKIFFHAITRPDLIVDHLWNADTPRTLLYLFAGTGFLSLLRPKLLAPIVLLLLTPLLAVNNQQRMLELHYGVAPYAFTFVVAAMVLEAGYVARIIRSTPPHPKEKRELGDTPRPPAERLRLSALSLLRTSAASRRSTPGESLGEKEGDRTSLAQVGLAGLAVVLGVVMFAWKSPLPPSFAANMNQFTVDHHSDVAETFVDMAPGDAIVSAQASFVPHLSQRHDIFEFPRITPRATYVLVDDKRYVPGYDWPAYNDCRAKLPAFGFTLVREEEGIQLWQRSAEDARRLGSEGCG